jgi:hypothetical protein
MNTVLLLLHPLTDPIASKAKAIAIGISIDRNLALGNALIQPPKSSQAD